MPTYEYECKSCGTVIDVYQSITAAPLKKTHCEACGADRPVRRLIGTGGGVIFKGSGFYQTDYRSEGYKKDAKSETDAGSKSSDSAAKGSSDAKPGASASSTTNEAKKNPQKKPARPKSTD